MCFSYDRGSTYNVFVGKKQLIEGMDKALVGMCVNERSLVKIPPHLAYGSRGYGILYIYVSKLTLYIYVSKLPVTLVSLCFSSGLSDGGYSGQTADFLISFQASVHSSGESVKIQK